MANFEIYKKLAEAAYCRDANGTKHNSEIGAANALARLAKTSLELKNWSVVKFYNDIGGVEAVLYGLNKSATVENFYEELILAYRGTDDIPDLLSDASLALFCPSEGQLNRARQIFEDTKQYSATNGISITAHSLGGGLAQVVASDNGNNLMAVTFNAPGMLSGIYKNRKYPYITNYVALNDVIGCFCRFFNTAHKHIGNTKFFLINSLVYDPGKGKTLYKPHSAYINVEESDIFSLDESVKWNHRCAAAIASFDIKNNYKNIPSRGLCTENTLEEAVEILKQHVSPIINRQSVGQAMPDKLNYA